MSLNHLGCVMAIDEREVHTDGLAVGIMGEFEERKGKWRGRECAWKRRQKWVKWTGLFCLVCVVWYGMVCRCSICVSSYEGKPRACNATMCMGRADGEEEGL